MRLVLWACCWTVWHTTAHHRICYNTAVLCGEWTCMGVWFLVDNKFTLCSPPSRIMCFICVRRHLILVLLKYTNHTDSMGIIYLYFTLRTSQLLNHIKLLYPLFTTQPIFSNSRQPLLHLCNFPSSICLPPLLLSSSTVSRVSSVEGWRARSRGLRVSPNWTEPAVSATWSSPASAVPTKTGQWVCESDFKHSYM